MNHQALLPATHLAALTLPLVLSAPLLPAQNDAVFPSDHQNVPDGATSIAWYPYSYGVSRMMSLFESWDVGVPAGGRITRIGLRAEANRLSYGESLQIEVFMGQTDNDAASMDPDFTANYVGAPQRVVRTRVFTLPDLANPLNPNPDGDMVWLDLDVPHVFDPSRNLLVEWRIYGNSNGGAQFNYHLDAARFLSPVTSGRQGCPHSGGTIPQLASRPTRVGGNWTVDLRQAPANQPATLFLHVGNPLTPPVPLRRFLRRTAPSCVLQVPLNNLFSIPTTTSASGTASFRVPVPNDRIYNDLVVSSQVLALDFFAPGGAVTSNADQIAFGIDPAHAVCYAQGATSARGTVSRSYDPVFVFRWN